MGAGRDTEKDDLIADLERRLRQAEERDARLRRAARDGGQVARLQLLQEASQTFAEEVGDPDRLVQIIARTCSQLIGDFGAITLVRDDGEWLEQAAAYHPDPHLEHDYRTFSRATPVRKGEGVTGRVIQSNRPLLLAEVDPEAIAASAPEAYREIARRLNVYSYLGVAMHARGRVIGAISMARSRPGAPYSEDDVGFLQDLADRAALALENARLYAGLERRVADATAQLRAANQELQAFSHSVAHDLRAPLRAIDGYSRALLDDCAEDLGDDGKRYLRNVQESARRMRQIIEDLLALSQATRAELRRERVDLSELARAAVDRLRDAERDREVELVIEDGLVAEGDPRLLDVVLTNLLGNAWKFTAKRSAARIELAARPDERTTVYLVRDNGAGFDPVHVEKLFGLFQRLHSRSEFEGTGIGLATVERIVHRHGGRVWAEGEVDRGATFYFTLAPRGASGED